MACFALITDDGLDQIVETKTLAAREKRDLIKLGCNVRVKEFPNEDAAYAWCEAKGINS